MEHFRIYNICIQSFIPTTDIWALDKNVYKPNWVHKRIVGLRKKHLHPPPNIFHTIAELGIENGELERAKERECRAVISAITFGLAQHVIESSPSAHKECIQGISDLFRGDLIDTTKSRRTTKKKSQKNAEKKARGTAGPE